MQKEWVDLYYNTVKTPQETCLFPKEEATQFCRAVTCSAHNLCLWITWEFDKM
jgi:hypothetical protein